MVADLLAGQLATIRAALEADRRRGRLDSDADTQALAAFIASTTHSLSLLHRDGIGIDVVLPVADYALATLPTTNPR